MWLQCRPAGPGKCSHVALDAATWHPQMYYNSLCNKRVAPLPAYPALNRWQVKKLSSAVCFDVLR
jgi:hypothetical protein